MWHPPSPPVDVAGALRAEPVRAPHGPPVGGKLTIGQGALSRGVHALAGMSSPTPPAHGGAAMGAQQQGPAHTMKHTTGAGADTVGQPPRAAIGVSNMPSWKAKKLRNPPKKKYF